MVQATTEVIMVLPSEQNSGGPVRTTGRWNSYEAKCMAERDVPYGDKKSIVANENILVASSVLIETSYTRVKG